MLSLGSVRTAAAAAFLSLAAYAQAPAAPKPDDVVATVNGEKITAGLIQSLRAGATQQFQKALDQSNKDFLKSVAGLLVLSRRAEQEKLDQQAPYRDQLMFLRMNFLANAYLASLNSKTRVEQKEIEDYYAAHREDYEEAAVRAIYIAFSRNPGADSQGRKRLSEAEAKAKAAKLVSALRQGADFAQLAKENSDDAASAEKGGVIEPLKRNSTGVPSEIRIVVFALKPGEVSEPVPQPAGYYIFKLDQLKTTPFEEAASSIATQLQAQKVQQEVQRLLGSIEIRHVNEAFFADRPAAPKP